MNDVSPQRRDIAFVFQNYALYPHMTVAENMGFGLRMRRVPSREIKQRVAETGQSLGLEALLERYPMQLSGGERQRVALGRAIVRDPAVFLLDEPLSNLDAQLRTETRVALSRIQRRLGATFVFVTHDQVEAMTLADMLAVMRLGVLQQVGPPEELYARPREHVRRDLHRLAADEPARGPARGGRVHPVGRAWPEDRGAPRSGGRPCRRRPRDPSRARAARP